MRLFSCVYTQGKFCGSFYDNIPSSGYPGNKHEVRFGNVLLEGCATVTHFDDFLQIIGYRRCIPLICCRFPAMHKQLRMFMSSGLQTADLKTWIDDEKCLVAKDFRC